MKNPIFICGHRKSGTTMFHNLFDGHPEFLVYPSDLNLLYAYFPKYQDEGYTNEERLKRLEKVLFRDLKQQLEDQAIYDGLNMAYFREVFFDSLKEEELCNMRIIIIKLMEAFAKVTGDVDKIPVLKETSIEIYASEIKQWFPDARFIHLVRDPRDNFAALKSGVKNYYSKMGEDEKQTLASLIYRTRFGLEAGILNQSLFGEEQYLFVKFENLVLDTRSEILRIVQFLGIQFVDSLLIPTRLGKPVKGNNFDGNTFAKVTNKNIGRWKERISNEEAMIVEFHLNDLMQEFEYELAYSKEECLPVAAEFYKWQNYKYFFSDRFQNI